VAQFNYVNGTEANHLRHWSFVGIREDKRARDVVTDNYLAFTNYNDSLADSYLSVGSLLTCTSTGAGSGSGGGGGTGTSGGGPRPICTVEGTELDTPEGAVDNRIQKARFDAGIPVYLMGRYAPECIIGAEWVPLSFI
jgi:hypothetical protein